MNIIIDPSHYVLSQHLFIKFLGVSYFFAFWSLFVQVLGLYGSNGIIPLKNTLQAFQGRKQKNMFLKIPSLFWINSSDKMLRLTAAFGMIGSLFVMTEYMSFIALALLWICYLSFVSIGIVFFSFQWDALLLEVGFLGLFFAVETPPPSLPLLAAWFLLFRFMMVSGAVKLLSGCPEWRCLDAMKYHYETQPLPNKVAYYLHHFPKWFSKFSEGTVYFFELVVPFLILGTEDMRAVAFFLLVLFQLLIALTGNYAFFNLLSFTLCIPLLNNSVLEPLIGQFVHHSVESNYNLITHLFLQCMGFLIILLNAFQLIHLFYPISWISRILYTISPYYISNGYGLFARMTTVRNEIIIEGSNDGENWQVYEFYWKPGDLKNAPKQVAPYHPRLDWQMWFAALGSYQQNGWFINLLQRLLEGSPGVLKLLKINPFPNKPPKFIRALLYRYHFSDLQTKEKTGKWWVCTFEGNYTPILSIKE